VDDLDAAVIDIEEADDECRNTHWTLNISAEEEAAFGLQTEKLFDEMHDGILKDPQA